MQTATPRFHQLADAEVRPLKWRVLISFEKEFDEDIDFFTLDTSALDSGDFLQGTGDVVQEWDKYIYEDFSDRVVSLEWTREELSPSSAVMAMADVVLNNTDDLFTPGAGGDLDGFILPRRPIRIFAGFENMAVPVFIGLTETMPEISARDKTARFHCVDYMSHLFNRKISESVMYENLRIDEILDELLQLVGLNPMQYQLDVAYNTIKFAYFEKDSKFGDAVNKLMEAELGTFSLDENGILRFTNRTNYDDTPVMTLTRDNTIDFKTRQQNEIINVVEVTANAREVQPNQLIFSLAEPIFVDGNNTTEVFFDYEDPVTSVDTPQYVANSSDDGSGSVLTSNISVIDQDNFSKSSRVVFSNSSSTPAYITELTVNGTPAKVIKEVFVREQDDASIEKYDEQVLVIENDYIQNENEAQSLALLILSQFSQFAAIYGASIKGNPALQTNDQIETTLDTEESEYAVTKIQGSIINGTYNQTLELKVRQSVDLFTLDESELNGGHVLSP